LTIEAGFLLSRIRRKVVNKEASADFNKRQTMRGESEKAGLAAAAAAMHATQSRMGSPALAALELHLAPTPSSRPSACSLAERKRFCLNIFIDELRFLHSHS